MKTKSKPATTLMVSVALAASLCVFPPSATANIEHARDTVVETLDQVYSEFQLAVSSNANLELAALDIMRRDLLPRLDVRKFMKLILARHWRSASQEQRDQFTEVLTEFLLRSFAVALVGENESISDYYESIEVLPAIKGRKDGRAMVVVHVRGEQRTTEVAFQMNFTDEGWKVYDVVFEGVSFAINYRAILNSEIGKHGLDEVTRSLFEKLSR